MLRRREPAALQAFLAATARRYNNEAEAQAIEAMEPEELLLTMHRMIAVRPDLADIQGDSVRWLRAHGIDPDLRGDTRNN